MKTRNNYFIFRVKVLLQRASFFRNFGNFPVKFSPWGWLNSKYLIYCMVRQLLHRFQKFNWFCCSYLRKFQTSILVWGLSKAKLLPFRSNLYSSPVFTLRNTLPNNYPKVTLHHTCFGISVQDSWVEFSKAHSELSQTSDIERFAKIANNWKQLINFGKRFILDDWLGSQYASGVLA